MDGTLNLDFAECIKTIANFGGNTYQNICTGTTATVPWGTMDWVLYGFLIVALATLVALTTAVVASLLKNIF